MAQPVNTFSSYDMRGIREDLSNIIYDVSPDETPFFSKTKKVTAKNTFHEWQTDALRASADNFHIEGNDTVARARTATVRLGNYTQIFKDAVVIPDTDAGLDKAGRAGEMAYQILKVGKEVKLDIERALFANQARSVGTDLAGRRLAGVPAWLTSNTRFETGGGGANPTGDGTNARTDGTPTAFTQARFDAAMQSIWLSGGMPETVYLSSFQMNLALGFVGNNAQRNTVKSGDVDKLIDVYRTPWGTVEFVMTRENRARDVFVMQNDKWAIGVLRPMKQEELAKTGDATRRQIVTELTLCSLNEKASGAVFDNTVA